MIGLRGAQTDSGVSAVCERDAGPEPKIFLQQSRGGGVCGGNYWLAYQAQEQALMKALAVTSASVLALAVATGIAAAQQLSFDFNRINDTGVGEKIGTATVME